MVEKKGYAHGFNDTAPVYAEVLVLRCLSPSFLSVAEPSLKCRFKITCLCQKCTVHLSQSCVTSNSVLKYSSELS